MNKIDKISEDELKRKLIFLHPYTSVFAYVLVSAKTGRGLEALLAKIEKKLSKHKALIPQEVSGTM